MVINVSNSWKSRASSVCAHFAVGMRRVVSTTRWSVSVDSVTAESSVVAAEPEPAVAPDPASPVVAAEPAAAGKPGRKLSLKEKAARKKKRLGKAAARAKEAALAKRRQQMEQAQEHLEEEAKGKVKEMNDAHETLLKLQPEKRSALAQELKTFEQKLQADRVQRFAPEVAAIAQTQSALRDQRGRGVRAAGDVEVVRVQGVVGVVQIGTGSFGCQVLPQCGGP